MKKQEKPEVVEETIEQPAEVVEEKEEEQKMAEVEKPARQQKYMVTYDKEN